MKEPQSIDVLDLFEPEREALTRLLEFLPAPLWNAPTACPGWSVKDVAAHLIGDDAGIVTRWRDGDARGSIAADDWTELVAEINRRNEAWVGAMRRLSPRLVVDLLRYTAAPTLAAFRARDPIALGGAVAWAGSAPAPGWLHVAREFTERWHHQQQIREAVGAGLLDDPAFLGPVLATFARALPRAYADHEAPPGTRIDIEFAGPAGSRWTLVRRQAGWALVVAESDNPSAIVRLDQDTAWRIFTRGLPANLARQRVTVEGEAAWGEPFLSAVAILA